MSVEARIARWLDEDGGRETEDVIGLFVDAEAELRVLRRQLQDARGRQ